MDMPRLTARILEQMAALPEGAAVSARALLHLGTRAAVDQSLSRLVRRGKLLRAGRGLYVRPVATRFGTRPPSVQHVVDALAGSRGEVIVAHGAAAANALGLTTQVPVRAVYLTSGRSRELQVGAQTVELRHAPAWQLSMPGTPAGDAIRALSWLGEAHAGEALRTLRQRLPTSTLTEIVGARSRLPTWLAEQVSQVIVNA
jgi:hypothetical protein